MRLNLDKYIDQNKQLFTAEMKKSLEVLSIPEELKASMLYSIEAGGKKIRPILLMASYETFKENNSFILSVGIALEMIHTYSLIHDDLPAMDDDDFRRGKPTNHKVFNESTAILAGDALLTYSFEMIATDPKLSDLQKVKLIGWLAKASGPAGMVAGQILDMEAEKKAVTLEALEEIHSLKTGELLKFAIIAGAYLGNATQKQLDLLETYAYYLGLIFQVQDDILDVTGDPDKIGKPIGSDQGNEKSTYPKLLGTAGAIAQKQIYAQKAKDALVEAEIADSYLMDLIDYFSKRDH